MKKKLEENCNFPKNEKLQFSSSFSHFFIIFFLFYNHFFHFFIIFASSGAKILQEMEKVTNFLAFFVFIF